MNSKNLILPVLLALLIAVGSSAFYFYQQRSVPQSDAKQQAEAALIARVGKLVLLPEGETPTIATVSNPEKLRDQPFFAGAKEGDKVLVYTLARKVYLYDPVNNLIVTVAPLTIETAPPPAQ